MNQLKAGEKSNTNTNISFRSEGAVCKPPLHWLPQQPTLSWLLKWKKNCGQYTAANTKTNTNTNVNTNTDANTNTSANTNTKTLSVLPEQPTLSWRLKWK